ncbi:MAG: hypothetical protein HOY78_15225 [Saccharothrix sp.]|nr:hypothetical protein [Saccharothrix sp.]
MLVSTVRLGRDEYRVIRPARPLSHAPLTESWSGAELSVNGPASADLASAWWLAARSPRSLVYLPLRGGRFSCDGEGRQLDLVLLHHSLGFPVSRWKAVRSRLSTASVHTVRLPARPFPEVDHGGLLHREFRDHLRWSVAAETLFLIGSRRAYEREGETIRALAEDSSADLARSPAMHWCAELDLGRRWQDHRNPASTLHVHRCEQHR